MIIRNKRESFEFIQENFINKSDRLLSLTESNVESYMIPVERLSEGYIIDLKAILEYANNNAISIKESYRSICEANNIDIAQIKCDELDVLMNNLNIQHVIHDLQENHIPVFCSIGYIPDYAFYFNEAIYDYVLYKDDTLLSYAENLLTEVVGDMGDPMRAQVAQDDADKRKKRKQKQSKYPDQAQYFKAQRSHNFLHHTSSDNRHLFQNVREKVSNLSTNQINQLKVELNKSFPEMDFDGLLHDIQLQSRDEPENSVLNPKDNPELHTAAHKDNMHNIHKAMNIRRALKRIDAIADDMQKRNASVSQSDIESYADQIRNLAQLGPSDMVKIKNEIADEVSQNGQKGFEKIKEKYRKLGLDQAEKAATERHNMVKNLVEKLNISPKEQERIKNEILFKIQDDKNNLDAEQKARELIKEYEKRSSEQTSPQGQGNGQQTPPQGQGNGQQQTETETTITQSQAGQTIQSVNKLTDEAEKKPKAFIAKVIYSLRGLYRKWLEKQNQAKKEGKDIGFFTNILRVITNCIDKLLKKLQGWTNFGNKYEEDDTNGDNKKS